MSFLILGGNSMMGKNFRKYLKKNNIDFTFTTRRKKISKNAIFFDINKKIKIKKKFSNVFFFIGGNKKFLSDKNEKDFNKFNSNCIRCIKFFHKNGSKIIFISSDAVFEGSKKKKLNENVKTIPIYKYGIHKVYIENEVKKLKTRYAIIRLPKVISSDTVFFKNRIKKLLNKKNITVFDDYYFAPITIDYLIKVLMNKKIEKIIHLSGIKITYYNFFKKLVNYLKVNKKLLKRKSLKDLNKDYIQNNFNCSGLGMKNTIKQFNFNKMPTIEVIKFMVKIFKIKIK